jgi:hypothetical protein
MWSLSLWGHHLSHQDQPLAAYMIYKNPSKILFYINKILFKYRVFGENSSGSSNTKEKALKTLSRSKATIIRTFDIVQKITERKEEYQHQLHKYKEIIYIENLYKNQNIKAIKLFIFLWKNFWNNKKRIKELKRLLGVLIIGTDTFLKIKSKG